MRRLTSSVRSDERGFTLVEVMVAIFLVLVGVLGAVTMIDTANHTTAVTRAREGGVNIARAVLESAHSIPYSQLDPTDAIPAIQAEPGLADSDTGTAGWQITRRNVVYTVSFSACSVDDPADGIGTHDGTFCSGQSATPTTPPDSQPADYKRASVTVSWRTPGGRSTTTTTQSTVIAGSYRGPNVTSLTGGPNGVFTDSITNPAILTFNVTADSGTDHVEWFLDDNDQGQALGCGTFCPISWNLGKPTGSAPCDPNGGGVIDGTYVLKASAYDVNGLSGNSRAITVQLNRCPPLAPTGLEGGQTKWVSPPASSTDQWHTAFPGVELQWDQSSEEDVVGYHVYKSPFFPISWTQVAAGSNPDPNMPGCDGLVTTPNCVDADAPNYEWYSVAAVDKDPSGNLREGAKSSPILVNPTNTPPSIPFKASCYTATPNSLQWTSGSGDSFYYIYRDNFTGRGDRYDSISNTGGTITWTDPDPGGVAHKYWITAVNSSLNESDPAPGDPPAHYIQWDATGSTCTKQ